MSGFMAMSVADVSSRTIDAFQDMLSEIPNASSIEDLSDVFLRGDRKIYSGIMLAIAAALMIVLMD